MTKWIVFLAVLLVSALCFWAYSKHRESEDAKLFRTVDADEFERVIAGDVTLLDVRTQSEYDAGHLGGAVLVDVMATGFIEKACDALPPDKPVAVYCRSGHRSANAARQLVARGYEVVNLDGGILAWQKAGKATLP